MNFIDICKLPQEQLKAKLEEKLTGMGYEVVNEDGFLFAEGDVPVMLVAHMDTVHKDNCTIVCISENGNYVMSPQGIGGDDRCGIYMALEIIKQRRCSVLFTEDEEIGCVGARKFCDTKYKPEKLNYIIEFDRKNGDDAVFYSCDNPDFTKFCTDGTGFKEASGSCSDISHVAPHLGVAAVNFSCGYYNAHTCHEYVKLSEMERNIQRAITIIDKPCEKFEYIEKKYSYVGKYSGMYVKPDDYDYDAYWWKKYWGDTYSKNKTVSSDDDQTNIIDYEDQNEAYYKKVYECDEEPDWEAKGLKTAMSLEADIHYLVDSEGNTYSVDNDFEYFLDEDGNVYYSGALYPLAYMVDAQVKSICDDKVKFEESLSVSIIEVSAGDWDKVNEYYNKLQTMDSELNTTYAWDYIDDLQSMCY